MPAVTVRKVTQSFQSLSHYFGNVFFVEALTIQMTTSLERRRYSIKRHYGQGLRRSFCPQLLDLTEEREIQPNNIKKAITFSAII